MIGTSRRVWKAVVGALIPGLISGQATAVEITDRLWIGGVASGAYQWQTDGNVPEAQGGAAVFQPRLFFRPTRRDRLFVKLGFARGNGLLGEEDYAFSLLPWAADLEEDVRNINGTGRDALLTAWYMHRFGEEENQVRVTAGIIDATDYLDDNAYANDEFTQFLNEVFVNASGVFFPSYNPGIVVEWERGAYALDALVMDVPGDDRVDPESPERFQGQALQYFAVQLTYRLSTPLGKGRYRLIIDRTSKDLSAADGSDNAASDAVFISIDQELGYDFGIFLRAVNQLDDASARHRRLVSTGVDIHAMSWGNAGIGVARFDGGNQDIEFTWTGEAYVRWPISKLAQVTLDLQRIREGRRSTASVASGWIAGLRFTSEF